MSDSYFVWRLDVEGWQLYIILAGGVAQRLWNTIGYVENILYLSVGI